MCFARFAGLAASQYASDARLQARHAACWHQTVATAFSRSTSRSKRSIWLQGAASRWRAAASPTIPPSLEAGNTSAFDPTRTSRTPTPTAASSSSWPPACPPASSRAISKTARRAPGRRASEAVESSDSPAHLIPRMRTREAPATIAMTATPIQAIGRRDPVSRLGTETSRSWWARTETSKNVSQ